MDSTLSTIMYYLMHILAIFGLIFMLILLVRITMWCLMCNLKHEKKRRNTRRKLKALLKAEAGGQLGVSNPPTLRRSPNVQRLNLIKPEDETKFVNGKSNTLRSNLSESSSSNNGTLPPTPPPKDIEAVDENVQQQLDAEGPVYATLAFPKRKAPPPPSQPAVCICPFCKVMKQATLKPVDHSHEDEEQEEPSEPETAKVAQECASSDDDIEVITSEEVNESIQQTTPTTVDQTLDDDIEMVTIDTNELSDNVSDEIVVIIEHDNHNATSLEEENQFESLPKTPSPEPVVEFESLPKTPSPEPVVKSLSNSSESLATQSALNSLDQAIEEMDQVMNDLVVVVLNNKQLEEKITERIAQHEETLKPESDQMINHIEPEIVPENEQPEISEPQQQEEELEEETPPPIEPTVEVITETKTEETKTEEIKTEETKTEEIKTELILESKEAEPEPTIEVATKPTEATTVLEETKLETVEPEVETRIVKSRIEQFRRKSAAPRIVESIPKAKPVVPEKPIKLVVRTKSMPPVNNNGAEPLPQCMIYAQVIDQIKKRNQEKSSNSETLDSVAVED